MKKVKIPKTNIIKYPDYKNYPTKNRKDTNKQFHRILGKRLEKRCFQKKQKEKPYIIMKGAIALIMR